jgi:hypothetical protein
MKQPPYRNRGPGVPEQERPRATRNAGLSRGRSARRRAGQRHRKGAVCGTAHRARVSGRPFDWGRLATGHDEQTGNGKPRGLAPRSNALAVPPVRGPRPGSRREFGVSLPSRPSGLLAQGQSSGRMPWRGLVRSAVHVLGAGRRELRVARAARAHRGGAELDVQLEGERATLTVERRRGAAQREDLPGIEFLSRGRRPATGRPIR